jgi:hypothetical protein
MPALSTCCLVNLVRYEEGFQALAAAKYEQNGAKEEGQLNELALKMKETQV